MFKNKSPEKKSMMVKLLGSFLAAAALFGALIGIEKNMLDDYAKETVVLCREEVSKGTKITEKNVGQYFYVYDVDAVLVDESCVKEKEELIGAVMKKTFTAHEIIREDGFAAETEIYERYQEPVEASVAVGNPDDIVSGTVRRGDYVDIAVVNKDTLEYDLLLKNVYVVEAFTNTGEKVPGNTEGMVATMITVVEEKENLAKFYSARETGSVIVTKLSPEK